MLMKERKIVGDKRQGKRREGMDKHNRGGKREIGKKRIWGKKKKKLWNVWGKEEIGNRGMGEK